DRLRLSSSGLLSVAVLKNDFGRALDEDDLLAIRGLVERRHELVLRLERDGVDARRSCLLGLPIHAELGRERIERPLGRIAFHSPYAILLEKLSIVTENGDAPHEVSTGCLPAGFPSCLTSPSGA